MSGVSKLNQSGARVFHESNYMIMELVRSGFLDKTVGYNCTD
jgi:hypothetical protein